jgi:hypothetical protein
MKVYEVDLIGFEIITHDFGYVSNILSFQKEMNELYFYWFYSRTNAIKFFREQRSIIERDKSNLF